MNKPGDDDTCYGTQPVDGLIILLRQSGHSALANELEDLHTRVITALTSPFQSTEVIQIRNSNDIEYRLDSMEAKKVAFDAFIDYIMKNPESIRLALSGNFRITEENLPPYGAYTYLLESSIVSENPFVIERISGMECNIFGIGSFQSRIHDRYKHDVMHSPANIANGEYGIKSARYYVRNNGKIDSIEDGKKITLTRVGFRGEVMAERNFFRDDRGGWFQFELLIVSPMKLNQGTSIEILKCMVDKILEDELLRAEFMLYFIRKFHPAFGNFMTNQFRGLFSENCTL